MGQSRRYPGASTPHAGRLSRWDWVNYERSGWRAALRLSSKKLSEKNFHWDHWCPTAAVTLVGQNAIGADAGRDLNPPPTPPTTNQSHEIFTLSENHGLPNLPSTHGQYDTSPFSRPPAPNITAKARPGFHLGRPLHTFAHIGLFPPKKHPVKFLQAPIDKHLKIIPRVIRIPPPQTIRFSLSDFLRHITIQSISTGGNSPTIFILP